MGGDASENIISWAAGILSFAALGLLVYIAVGEVFLGRKLVTGIEADEVPEKPNRTAYLLPAALGTGLLAFVLIVCRLFEKHNFRDASGTILSLINVEGRGEAFSAVSIALALVSIFFFFCGSVAACRLGGSRLAVIFCLNPFALFMAGPFIYSMAAFLLVQGAVFARSRKYWGTALCAGVFILLHIPFEGLNIPEFVILIYTAAAVILGRKLKRMKKKGFETLAMALSLVMGGMAMILTVVSELL